MVHWLVSIADAPQVSNILCVIIFGALIASTIDWLSQDRSYMPCISVFMIVMIDKLMFAYLANFNTGHWIKLILNGVKLPHSLLAKSQT